MATVETTARAPADTTTADRAAGGGRRRMPRAAWYTICVLVAAMMLFPLVMLVLTSVKTPAEAAASPPTYLPSRISFQNFADLSANSGGLLRYVLNSVLVALGTVLGVVVLSTLGGYGFARYEFPGRNVLFIVILSTLMIPFQAILTPLFLVLAKVNLTNSLLGLTLVYITFQLPFALFLMRNSFSQVPQALEDAARLDGAGTMRALFSVMMPIVRPGIITTALFAFFASWNEFLAALILLSDQTKFTLPVLLTTLQTGQLGTLNWGILEAGVVITMIPCIIIFLLLQRYYVKGMTAGAVK
jgi:multiple sugar transport system permease protein